MRNRLWTSEERARAFSLQAMGLSTTDIGAQLGRSSDSVRWAFKKAAPPSLGQETSQGHEIQPPPTTTQAPAIHTSKTRAEAYLIISDLQIPYHEPGALDFCKRVRFEFGIPLENVLCVGDEFDFYWLSRFEHSPDAEHSPSGEIAAAKEEASRWKAAFPHLLICESNHVHGRLKGAAARGGLASPWIRTVREVFSLPETWRWADHWIIQASKRPFRIEHGHVKPGGHSGLRNRPTNRGISTAWGHEHAEPAAIHIDTAGGQEVWGMRVGSLLTKAPVAAFSYNAEHAVRPTASVGVVLDGGRLPLIVRM